MANTGEPPNTGFPLKVGEPGKVPARVAPFIVVAVSALTVILGVPVRPVAFPLYVPPVTSNFRAFVAELTGVTVNPTAFVVEVR
jgi:hypothetical protein